MLFFPVRVTGCHCMAWPRWVQRRESGISPAILGRSGALHPEPHGMKLSSPRRGVPGCSSMFLLFWQKMWVILWYFMPYVCICVVVTVSFILCHVVSAVSCGVLFSCTLMLLESFAVVSRSCCSRLLGVSGVSGVNSWNSCCHSVFLALQHYNAMQWTLLDISCPDVMTILCWMVW